jgi:hypothetical protein
MPRSVAVWRGIDEPRSTGINGYRGEIMTTIYVYAVPAMQTNAETSISRMRKTCSEARNFYRLSPGELARPLVCCPYASGSGRYEISNGLQWL